MNDEVLSFHQDYLETLARLQLLMNESREHINKIADLSEQIAVRKSLIQGQEDVLVLSETRPDGQINGKNEETRKVQRAAVLNAFRATPEMASRFRDIESDEKNLIALQRRHDLVHDEICLCKLKLEHINCVLRALAN